MSSRVTIKKSLPKYNFGQIVITFVKFRYCEKVTKFEKNPTISNVKTKWYIFSNFVAFSEYLKFNCHIYWNNLYGPFGMYYGVQVTQISSDTYAKMSI